MSVFFSSDSSIFCVITHENTLNSLSGKLLISVSFAVFSGVSSYSFNWNKFVCLLVLLNFYLISQRNSLQVSLCGAIPIQSACAHGFAGRAGFTLNTGHTFPESMMVAVPLLGGVARGGGARARARDELAVWPSAVTSLSGTGSGLKSLQHKSWGSVWAGSLPSVSPPHTSPRGNSARTRGAGVGTPSVGACAIGPAKVTDPDCFWYSACNGCPQPAHTLLQVWVASVSHGLSRKQDYRVSV